LLTMKVSPARPEVAGTNKVDENRDARVEVVA